MELRYLGFDQKQNTRAYRFKGVSNGEPTLYFVITADLSLFLAHHIGIQEGPSLCANKLASDLQEPERLNHELTNEDLVAHANARTQAEARKAEVRRNAARHS